MDYRNILITGGAGFVGSNLAVGLKLRHLAARITALDNLRCRGSDLNLTRLREVGVEFLLGDALSPEDLVPPLVPYDLLVSSFSAPRKASNSDPWTSSFSTFTRSMPAPWQYSSSLTTGMVNSDSGVTQSGLGSDSRMAASTLNRELVAASRLQ